MAPVRLIVGIRWRKMGNFHEVDLVYLNPLDELLLL